MAQHVVIVWEIRAEPNRDGEETSALGSQVMSRDIRPANDPGEMQQGRIREIVLF
jgi:hypothetical protein